MKKNERLNIKRIGFWAFSSVIIMWLSCWLFSFLAFSAQDANIGTFGDMFGSINSLFSGLAFAGVMIAIFLQREELKAMKDEFYIQNETLKLQRFENTFFQMLSLHNEIVNSTIRVDAETTSGRNHFRTINIELNETLNRASLHTKSSNDIIQTINYNYYRIYQDNLGNIGHYFINIENILKLVLESFPNNRNAQSQYINIFKAMFSISELNLILSHAISDLGKEKLKPLLEQTSFFADAPNILALPDYIRNLYNPSAFK